MRIYIKVPYFTYFRFPASSIVGLVLGLVVGLVLYPSFLLWLVLALRLVLGLG